MNDNREARYAEAIATQQLSDHPDGFTDLARAVMAVADAELAEARAEVERLNEQIMLHQSSGDYDAGYLYGSLTAKKFKDERDEAREQLSGLREAVEEQATALDELADELPTEAAGLRLGARSLRAVLAESIAPVAAEEGGEQEEGEEIHKTMWGVEVNGLAYGVSPNTRERAEQVATEAGVMVREVRECSWAGVTCSTPRPAPSGSDEQGNRPAAPDANGVHDTKGGE